MEIKKLTVDDCDQYGKELIRYIFESNNHCNYITRYTMDDAENKVEEMKNYIQNNKAIVYGAVEDDVLLGFVWGYEYPFREDVNRLYVSIIHIDAAYRSRGIGDLILSALEKEAADKGYHAVFLHTEAFNDGAIRFYHKQGFEKERIQLVKKLDLSEKPENFGGGYRVTAEYAMKYAEQFAHMYLENIRTHILMDSFQYTEAEKKIANMILYIRDEKAVVYCVTDESNAPVGMLWAHPYLINEEERMHVSVPVVMSEHRRKNYAAQMYEAMYSDMKQMGLDTVYTNVDAINQTSLLFHYKQGFEDEMYQFVKVINRNLKYNNIQN